MPGPWKPHSYYSNAGTTTQVLYAFVQELFDANNGPALRNQLMTAQDEDEVRAILNSRGIVIPRLTGPAGSPPVRIKIVDVQTARVWEQHPPIDPNNDFFYVLVMPPVPSNYAGQPGYTDMQAWESAWYHAIVDGYGM